MRNSMLKKIFLSITLISLSIIIAVIPSIVLIYIDNNGLWTSYMHNERKVIERDFYKSNKFDYEILNPMYFWITEIDEDTRLALKNNYPDILYFVKNKDNNTVYSNTEYKTVEDFQKNVNGYVDIEIIKGKEGNLYTKNINEKIYKDNKDVSYKLLDNIKSENIETYISIPEKLNYNSLLYSKLNEYVTDIKYIEL